MKDPVIQFRPLSNRISAALITLFVISFAVLADAHVESPSDYHVVIEFCAGSNELTNRFFTRYH